MNGALQAFDGHVPETFQPQEGASNGSLHAFDRHVPETDFNHKRGLTIEAHHILLPVRLNKPMSFPNKIPPHIMNGGGDTGVWPMEWVFI